MPRTFDGPIPERPDRNDLPDRLNDLLERFGWNGRPGGGERPNFWFDQVGTLRDLVFHDRGESEATKVASDGSARIGPAAPAITAPAVEERASADVAARHFEAEGDFNRHVDHYNSQALSAHPDWFML